MASRKEQKERARAERLAKEQARAAAARRAKRLRMVAGVVIAVAAVAAVVAAVVIGKSGSSGGSSGYPNPITPPKVNVSLPAQKTTNLDAAAKAAGCTQINTPDSIARTDNERTHVAVGTNVKYATNPPSYGPHYPVPAHDGEYKPSATPTIEYLVHALEHGRIEYQYRPGLASHDVQELEALMQEPEGTFAGCELMVMFQNPTNMPYAVAATAWGHVLGCKTFNQNVIDAFRAFRLAYTDKGPEQLGLGAE
jgi:hypothetical protein